MYQKYIYSCSKNFIEWTKAFYEKLRDFILVPNFQLGMHTIHVT
jgi:hypothetical protein